MTLTLTSVLPEQSEAENPLLQEHDPSPCPPSAQMPLPTHGLPAPPGHSRLQSWP